MEQETVQVEESTPEPPSLTQLEEWKAEEKQKIRAEVEAHYKELQLVWQAKDLAELEKKMDVHVQEGVQKLWEKWKEDQKPPTSEQIEKLVQQKYARFPVRLEVIPPGKPDQEEEEEMMFTIREAPKAVEEEFFAIFKKAMLENLPQINAFNQKNLDKPFEEKVKGMIEAIEGGLKMMSELVALVLDPRKKKGITPEWVDHNIGSKRQWDIIQAQLEANRLRDFFSSVSQSGQVIQTMTQPLSYQGLLQQLQS